MVVEYGRTPRAAVRERSGSMMVMTKVMVPAVVCVGRGIRQRSGMPKRELRADRKRSAYHEGGMRCRRLSQIRLIEIRR